MSYVLGIDIGTTFTAAAILRDGHAQVVTLGDKADMIPSVVLAREDATILIGEAARRRGLTEPHRLGREFKRRFGQPEPMVLGGTPYSPEALTALLLRFVVDAVVNREGDRPTRICLSRPANWGPFKVDLFQHVVRLAEVTEPVTFTTEPEAAAVSYAREQRVDVGSVVAVYDLGGGTFDAAVLARTADGFEILGKPEGIEQLGGIDVDAAVFHHVTSTLGDRYTELDEDDPAAVAAVARLRRECVDAKEGLSSDTDVSIPVVFPDYSTDVRLTRAELETMVRPMLGGTVQALRRALESAHTEVDEVASVLLVGGSSRMPIVAQLIGAELGRPVAVDAHPKHVVALGAAWLAEGPAQPATAQPATAPDDREHPDTAATRVDLETVSSDDMSDTARTLLDDEVSAPVRRTSRRTLLPTWFALAAVVAIVLLGVGGGVFLLSGSDDPATVDPKTAVAKLVDEDRGTVERQLLGRWTAQLYVQGAGVDQDGLPYGYQDVFDEHQRLSKGYDVLLLDTSAYPASFVMKDSFAVVTSRTFDKPEGVLLWCAEQGFADEDCFAKRISRTGLPRDHFMRPSTGSDPRSGLEGARTSPPGSDAPAPRSTDEPDATSSGTESPSEPATEPTETTPSLASPALVPDVTFFTLAPPEPRPLVVASD